jgi:hypothetical protein
MSEETTVGTVTIGESSTLVFSVSHWQGRWLANVRKFVASQKYKGPTKSGFILSKKVVRELVTALAELDRTIPSQEEGEFKTIAKNEREYIRIATVPDKESGGLPWVDVREYVHAPSYHGPTKRGIRFRWNLLPEVLICFQEQGKVVGENEKSEPSLFKSDLFEQADESEEKARLFDAPSLTELLGESVKQFPDDFLAGLPNTGTRLKLPEASLRLDQDNTGRYLLKSEDRIFTEVRNPTEGNFILYAQLRGHRDVLLPKKMIDIFRTVKAYENYLRGLRRRLFSKLLKKTRQESVANYETEKLFRTLGLPKLDT